MINIKGKNKADVLAALYNNSKVQGMGFLQVIPGHYMTRDEARNLLQKTTYFDYLFGKIMKVNLSKDDSFDERLYDRDNGIGAAQKAIDGIE